MTDAIDKAREVAAKGELAWDRLADTRMSFDDDSEPSIGDHNALRAGFLALDAELAAVKWLELWKQTGISPARCIGYSREMGWVATAYRPFRQYVAPTAVELRAKLEAAKS